MKGITLVLALCVLWLGIVSGQETETQQKNRKNAFQLQAGAEIGYFKDKNFSPLNYANNGTALRLGYERQFKKEHQLFATINAQLGWLTSDVSKYNRADAYTVDVMLGYLHHIPVNASKLKLHVGGQYHSYLDLVFYGGTNAVTFFGLHSVDLLGKVSWEISDKHHLQGSLALPVAGLFVRPPYTGWDKYITEHARNPLPVFFRGHITSLNDYLAFNLNLDYTYVLGPKLDLIAGYQFSYHRTAELKTAILPSNQLLFGTRFKF